MKTFEMSAQVLGDKLKAHARNKVLDVNKAASRHVGERLLLRLLTSCRPSTVPIGGVFLKGGMLFPQHIRQTSDLDILLDRGSNDTSEFELIECLEIACEDVAREGIDVSAVSDVRFIDVGYGDPIMRVYINAKVGGIRANTQVDVQTATSNGAFPLSRSVTTVRSLIPEIESFQVRSQPWSACIAEKLLACITQQATDTRTKHFDDIELLARRGFVKAEAVADELLRVMRYRGLPISILSEEPEALSRYPSVMPRAVWMAIYPEVRERMLRNSLTDDYRPSVDIDAILRSAYHDYEYTPNYNMEDAA